MKTTILALFVLLLPSIAYSEVTAFVTARSLGSDGMSGLVEKKREYVNPRISFKKEDDGYVFEIAQTQGRDHQFSALRQKIDPSSLTFTLVAETGADKNGAHIMITFYSADGKRGHEYSIDFFTTNEVEEMKMNLTYLEGLVERLNGTRPVSEATTTASVRFGTRGPTAAELLKSLGGDLQKTDNEKAAGERPELDEKSDPKESKARKTPIYYNEGWNGPVNPNGRIVTTL